MPGIAGAPIDLARYVRRLGEKGLVVRRDLRRSIERTGHDVPPVVGLHDPVKVRPDCRPAVGVHSGWQSIRYRGEGQLVNYPCIELRQLGLEWTKNNKLVKRDAE